MPLASSITHPRRRGRGGNSGASPPATTRRTARTLPKSRHSWVCLRANHRPAFRRALPCLYVWLRAGVHVSWRPPKRTHDPAPCRATGPGAPGVAAYRGRPGGHCRLRHADRLVRDRPHAGQDVRSPARPDFSRRHRRRALLRTDRSRRLRCDEHGGGSRRVLRAPRIFG